MSHCRLARGREEWESAALQNANTKCNGLLPLWGPQVQESAFATCLARQVLLINDPHCEKACLQGSKPGKTQISLHSYTDRFDISDISTIDVVLSKRGADWRGG